MWIEVYGGETWGKEPAGRPRHRWGNNIKIGLEKVRIHWIDLPHDWDRKLAVVKETMTVQVSQNAENFLTSWGTISFSGRTLLCAFILTVFRMYRLWVSSANGTAGTDPGSHIDSAERWEWTRVDRRRSFTGTAGSNSAGIQTSVSCEYYVLSRRVLCDRPIPRPGEGYHVCVSECNQVL